VWHQLPDKYFVTPLKKAPAMTKIRVSEMNREGELFIATPQDLAAQLLSHFNRIPRKRVLKVAKEIIDRRGITDIFYPLFPLIIEYSADGDPTAPPGAVWLGEWTETSDGEEWRSIEGPVRESEASGKPAKVRIHGEQYRSGRIIWYAYIDEACMKAEHLGTYAEMLLAIRDEFEAA